MMNVPLKKRKRHQSKINESTYYRPKHKIGNMDLGLNEILTGTDEQPYVS